MIFRVARNMDTLNVSVIDYDGYITASNNTTSFILPKRIHNDVVSYTAPPSNVSIWNGQTCLPVHTCLWGCQIYDNPFYTPTKSVIVLVQVVQPKINSE